MGQKHRSTGARGFLARLARDTRANTLAIMTMALIPLAGMVGGAVDISRMYIVKTRLQHACDAGALAGRKMMSSGVWSFNNYAARTSANTFFDANFPVGSYGANTVTKDFTENAGKVTGSASAVLPMTLMRIFGRTNETLSVTCDAEMRLPNTDVMFVLDTTGSMDQDDGTGTKKINGLRFAVKCFYQIVARLDVADADCEGPEPSGGTGNQVQIRFGFVPYSVNVNVGKLLKPEWFADSWNYQTREAIMRTESTPVVTVGDWVNGAPVVTSENTPLASSTNWVAVRNFTITWRNPCETDEDDPLTSNGPEGNPYSVSESISGNTRTTTWRTDMPAKRQYKYQARQSGSTCYIERRINYGTMTRTYSRTDTRSTSTTYTTREVFDKWRYKQLAVDVSKLKNGTGWNGSFQWPVASGGTDKTINWNGCIEERKTERTTDYDPIPDTALDLNFDSTPTSDNATKWGPYLPDVVYTRRSNWTRDTVETADDYGNGSYSACPTEAKRLQSWTDASLFGAYVNSLRPVGNTYHDIGLLWGARLASPSGIFGDDNDYTDKGGEIERHIIFMTDGDTVAPTTDYNAYGIPWFDRRQTPDGSAPSQANTEQQVDLRFAALCQKIKNATFNGRQAYTLWVISFGAVSADTTTRLTNCATTNRYYSATDSAALQTTFKQIADQISQLRLTR